MIRRLLKRQQQPQKYWIVFRINNKRYVLSTPFATPYEADEKGTYELAGVTNMAVVPLKTADNRIAGKMLKAEIITKSDYNGMGSGRSHGAKRSFNIFSRG